jgi:translation initiation factor IF-3
LALNKPFNRGPRLPFKKKEAEHNINQFIRAQEVRLVGDNVEQGIFSLRDALAIAQEQELDLVEISPNAVPPVCKVTDYNKFVYEQKKKLKEIKSNAKQTVIKEIRFGPNTDDHDFEFKLKHAQKFLEAGEKVRAYVHFKGRAIVYKEQGEILLLRFAQALEDLGKVEQLPKLEGKRMFLTVAPKAQKNNNVISANACGMQMQLK